MPIGQIVFFICWLVLAVLGGGLCRLRYCAQQIRPVRRVLHGRDHLPAMILYQNLPGRFGHGDLVLYSPRSRPPIRQLVAGVWCRGLTYALDGHMSVFIADPRRKPSVSPKATDAEGADLYRTMLAYTGTYSVDGNKVTHEIECNFPNFYRHTLTIANFPATKSAIAQQGITLEGPVSGSGMRSCGASPFRGGELSRRVALASG